MVRSVSCLAAVVLLSSTVEASLHRFISLGSLHSANEIVVLTPGGRFVLDDSPDSTGFKYAATNPLQIRVKDAGGNVDLDLTSVAVNDDFVTMMFRDGHSSPHELRMIFSNTGTTQGDPFPDLIQGAAIWNLPGHFADTGQSIALGGLNAAQVAAVPEPSFFAFGSVVLGLIGIGQFIRRRLRKTV